MTLACEQRKGKTNSATSLASRKGTRLCSTVLGSATTGKQDSTQIWTSTVESSACGRKSYRHVHPKCKSSNVSRSVNQKAGIKVLYLF